MSRGQVNYVRRARTLGPKWSGVSQRLRLWIQDPARRCPRHKALAEEDSLPVACAAHQGSCAQVPQSQNRSLTKRPAPEKESIIVSYSCGQQAAKKTYDVRFGEHVDKRAVQGSVNDVGVRRKDVVPDEEESKMLKERGVFMGMLMPPATEPALLGTESAAKPQLPFVVLRCSRTNATWLSGYEAPTEKGYSEEGGREKTRPGGELALIGCLTG